MLADNTTTVVQKRQHILGYVVFIIIVTVKVIDIIIYAVFDIIFPILHRDGI